MLRLAGRYTFTPKNHKKGDSMIAIKKQPLKITHVEKDYSHLNHYENEVFLYLEELRESGETNMFGAVPYLQERFQMHYEDAKDMLSLWMKSYNKDDEYEEEE